MELLTYVARYGSPLADDQHWPNAMVGVTTESQIIREHLEAVTSKHSLLDSQRFKVNTPDLVMIETLSSPVLLLQGEPTKIDTKLDLNKILISSKINLSWVPVENINTLQDCMRLFAKIHFRENDAYQFSIVFASIEKFFSDLARDYLAEKAKLATDLDPDLLIDVFKEYGNRLDSFRKGDKTGGLMSVELYSQ